MSICFRNKDNICECKSHNRLCPFNLNILLEYINKISIEKKLNIILINNPSVLRWIYGDTSFLTKNLTIEELKMPKTKQRKRLAILEHLWGQKLLKNIRPDLSTSNQWTTKLGEFIVEELYKVIYKSEKIVRKPRKKENYCPDLEINDAILEVKTQTFFTDGTAGEKILGTPFKYADIPLLYSKKLSIVCVAQAENLSRTSYGNIKGEKTTENKLKILNFFKNELNIEFLGASELLDSLFKEINSITV